jgi:sRNA-binding protein
LRACHAGADRIDLDGQVVGKVTAHEAANAAAKLARARQKILARKVGDPADATTSNKADAKTSNKPHADIEPSPPSEVVALPNRRLTLADLRLLAQARKAAS